MFNDTTPMTLQASTQAIFRKAEMMMLELVEAGHPPTEQEIAAIRDALDADANGLVARAGRVFADAEVQTAKLKKERSTIDVGHKAREIFNKFTTNGKGSTK